MNRMPLTRIYSAGEVEIALHQLLTQQDFIGTGHIRVTVIGPASWPTYIVGLSADSAAALHRPLSAVPGGWAPYNATNWVLCAGDVAAIMRLSGMVDEPVATGAFQWARA